MKIVLTLVGMKLSMSLDKVGIDAISRIGFGTNTHRFYLIMVFWDETMDDKVWPWPYTPHLVDQWTFVFKYD